MYGTNIKITEQYVLVLVSVLSILVILSVLVLSRVTCVMSVKCNREKRSPCMEMKVVYNCVMRGLCVCVCLCIHAQTSLSAHIF